jgi:hypothetical protein
VIWEEFQDGTPLYVRLVQMVLRNILRRKRCGMAPPKLVMFGDPAQSIMWFQGALADAEQTLITTFQPKLITLVEAKRNPTVVTKMSNEWMLANHETFVSRITNEVPLMKPRPNAPKGLYLSTGSYANNPVDQSERSAVLVRNNKDAKKIFYKNVEQGRDSLLVASNTTPLTVQSVLLKELNIFARNNLKTLGSIRERLIERESVAHGTHVRKQMLVLLDNLVRFGVDQADPNGSFHLGGLIRRTFSEAPQHTVSTVHGAKGLEWMRVYGVGIDRDIPSAQAKRMGGMMLEQEVKLYFVFLTRTKRDLFFVKDFDALFSAKTETIDQVGLYLSDDDGVVHGNAPSSPRTERTARTLANALADTEESSSKRARTDAAVTKELTAYPTAALRLLGLDALPPNNRALKTALDLVKAYLAAQPASATPVVTTDDLDRAAQTVRTYIYRYPDGTNGNGTNGTRNAAGSSTDTLPLALPPAKGPKVKPTKTWHDHVTTCVPCGWNVNDCKCGQTYFDAEDQVYRCTLCGWEVVDGKCPYFCHK